jgi:hypothetical protein
MALPDDNDARGARLRPYVWLIDRTGGVPNMPTTITINGADYELHDGNPQPITVAGLPGLVYRTTDGRRMFVLVRVANVTASGRTAMVAIGWFPVTLAQARDFWDQVEGQLAPLIAAWPCALDTDGRTWLATGSMRAAPLRGPRRRACGQPRGACCCQRIRNRAACHRARQRRRRVLASRASASRSPHPRDRRPGRD